MNIFELDKTLFFLINKTLANPFLDVFMHALSSKGYLLYLPYVFYFLFLGYNKKVPFPRLHLRTALLIIFISFCSFLITDWSASQLKQIIARQRPCNILEGVRLLVTCTKSYSMPSNHAANAFSFTTASIYFAMRYIHRWLILYLLALASLIALSRVYVGVHYPSDVIVGALVGVILAISVVGLYIFTSSSFLPCIKVRDKLQQESRGKRTGFPPSRE